MKPADISNQVRYYEEVPSLLRSELLRFGEGATVIHAGHYMLHVADNGHASDYLGSESEPRPGFEAFEFFTRATWDIACEAIQQAGSSGDLKLMVLVNDWQCLIFRAVSRRESERGAAGVRAAYYSRLAGLPDYHESELRSHGLGPDSVLRASASRAVFSESELRQQLSGTVRDLMRDTLDAERLGLRCYFDEHGEPLVRVETEDCTSIPLVQSGHTNCAGEVVELLYQLQQRGIRNFINLYPAQCKEPVEAGTELAVQLFGLSGMVISNVAIHCSEPRMRGPA